MNASWYVYLGSVPTACSALTRSCTLMTASPAGDQGPSLTPPIFSAYNLAAYQHLRGLRLRAGLHGTGTARCRVCGAAAARGARRATSGARGASGARGTGGAGATSAAADGEGDKASCVAPRLERVASSQILGLRLRGRGDGRGGGGARVRYEHTDVVGTKVEEMVAAAAGVASRRSTGGGQGAKCQSPPPAAGTPTAAAWRWCASRRC